MAIPAALRAIRGLLAAGIAGFLVAAPAVSAWADAPSNWWYDYFKVADVQAEGWTGAGVKVAVIDGQINPNLPVFQGADLTVHEPAYCGGSAATGAVNEGSSHGTNVTALLVGNGQGPGAVRGIAPRAKVTLYGYGDLKECRSPSNSDGHSLSGFGQSLHQAVADGNRIVTTSVALASVTQGDLFELAKVEAAGVIVVSATMNSYEDDTPFPYSVNGVVSVEPFDQSGNLMKDFNDSSRLMVLPEVTVVAPGVGFPSIGSTKTGSWSDLRIADGTSLATPLVAGMLAVTWQKYPKATGNQLIQSLIRNTGTTVHALQRDTTGGLGYGPASLRHLLSVDPAQYPDTNPLMDKSYGKPTAQDVSAAAASMGSGSASPAESQAVQAAESSSRQASNGVLVGLLVIASAVGVVALVGTLLLVVLIRWSARRSRRSGAQSVEVSMGVGSPGVDDSANRESRGTTVRGDGF